MKDKTRKEKVDLLNSWKYTLDEWNQYWLFQFVDYRGTHIKHLIKKEWEKSQSII